MVVVETVAPSEEAAEASVTGEAVEAEVGPALVPHVEEEAASPVRLLRTQTKVTSSHSKVQGPCYEHHHDPPAYFHSVIEIKR